MHFYLTIVLVTALTAMVLTPLAAKLARTWGVVDNPGVRKVHEGAVPYLGGAAIFGALLLGLVVLLVLARDPAASFHRLDPRMLVLLGGSAAMFALGLMDDIHHVRARHKFLLQVFAASVVYASGIQIDSIRLTEGVVLEFGVFGYLITVLWIVGITNAVNIIDGIDGLASGFAAIGCGAIAFVALQSGNYPTAALMFALLGALLGFLPYNFHPARIFLGDSGSLFLGFTLASTTIYSSTKSAAFIGLAVPAIALGIPILDTVFAMARRAIERRSLFAADRNHIHHRLLALGYGHRRVVLLLCGETAVATVLACLLLGGDPVTRFLALAGIIAMHVFLFRMTGAVRLRESYRAFKKVAAIAKEASAQKKEFDELELHFRESSSIGDWWRAVSLAAARMEFAQMRLELDTRDGPNHTLAWSHDSDASDALAESPLTVSVPVRQRRQGPPLAIEIRVPCNGSLESAGRRITFFGRLLDQHSIADLPSTPRPATRETGGRALAGFASPISLEASS